MPVPDPPPETAMLVCGLTSWYSSAHARARFTIVSDPVLFIYSLDSEEGGASEPGCEEQAANKIINRINVFINLVNIRMIIATLIQRIKDSLLHIAEDRLKLVV